MGRESLVGREKRAEEGGRAWPTLKETKQVKMGLKRVRGGRRGTAGEKGGILEWPVRGDLVIAREDNEEHPSYHWENPAPKKEADRGGRAQLGASKNQVQAAEKILCVGEDHIEEKGLTKPRETIFWDKECAERGPGRGLCA